MTDFQVISNGLECKGNDLFDLELCFLELATKNLGTKKYTFD